MDEKTNENINIDDLPKDNKTMTFSLDKTRKVSVNAVKTEPEVEEIRESEEEQELLEISQAPTEFEDIFSDEEKVEEEFTSAEGVVTVEEVFEQQKEKIDENFHNETEIIPNAIEDIPRQKKNKAAIIAAVICGAIILSAIAVAVIILI